MARRTRTRARRSNARRRRKRPAALGRWLSWALAAFVLVAVAAVAWLLLVYPKRPGPGHGRAAHLVLPEGASMGRVADVLHAAGVVDSPRLFAIYGRLVGADDQLRSGSMVITDDLSPAGVLPHIARGFGPAYLRVAIPEGYTRFDIADRLDDFGVVGRDAFVRATGSAAVAKALGVDAPTLEGYLFPATYELAKGTPARQIARDMVQTFRQRVLPVVERHAAGLARLQRELGFGLYEVVTLASIVEKEAAVHEERPVIAGVFLNRLSDPDFEPKRLQADPTVAYGCLAAPEVDSCANFDGHVSGTMLRGGDNPYNTYRIDALPPGPIANPGVDAIRAVLDPAHHDYLYFVARGGGRHHFSHTLAEHNRAVDRYQHRGSP